MARAVVLQHVSHEGPARLSSLLRAYGFALYVRELHRGAPVPERLERGDILVVLGGPMGIGDMERPELGFLRRELQLLSRCLQDGTPVLGICLGAQLLAFAAGASVHQLVCSDRERCYEVGWGAVRFHRTNDYDPILNDVPREAQVLHWHGDVFELPERARLLASTALCPNQAFALGHKHFGLQFHPELDAEHVEALLEHDADLVSRSLGPGGPARIRRDTQRNSAAARALGDRLLDNLLLYMTGRTA